MDFDFSSDEKMVRDQVDRYLMDNCENGVFRSVLDGETAYSEDVWQGLVEMGVPGTAISEAYGGVGAGYSTLCLVAEQLGAYLAPTPFSSSIYLAAEAIQLFGSEAQKQKWLPKFAAGEVIGTLAVTESTEESTEENIKTNCNDGKLSGTKLIVPHAGLADICVVISRTNDGEVSMYLAELDGVTKTPVATVDDTMNSCGLTFVDTPCELLGAAGNGWSQLNQVYDRAAVLVAFEQIGGAKRALDMAVDYAKGRFAFGRPIGSFQALKHMMADMYVALKLAESNCYYAAWALSTNSEELPLAAATARVSATQAYQLCARDNIQVHGGMGFTWEFDCHFYYRRSNYLTLMLGGVSTWEDKLVNALPNTRANALPSGKAA
jgi:acyl-CoA dehydrogenase